MEINSSDITVNLTRAEFDSLLYCLGETAKKGDIDCARAFPIIAALFRAFPKYRRLSRMFTRIAKQAILK